MHIENRGCVQYLQLFLIPSSGLLCDEVKGSGKKDVVWWNDVAYMVTHFNCWFLETVI